jgi:hypothetical protein
METYILRQNVVSYNVLLLANENELFKGHYVAIVKEYTYATPWSDKEHVKRFKKRETLFKFMNRYYPEIEIHN